jgi:hypothetical protein
MAFTTLAARVIGAAAGRRKATFSTRSTSTRSWLAPYRRAVLDFRKDEAVEAPAETAPPNAILLFDGVFLHRDELVHLWDFTVFVDVTFETALERAVKRDAELFGCAEQARELYLRRYFPAQRAYLAACEPPPSRRARAAERRRGRAEDRRVASVEVTEEGPSALPEYARVRRVLRRNCDPCRARC